MLIGACDPMVCPIHVCRSFYKGLAASNLGIIPCLDHDTALFPLFFLRHPEPASLTRSRRPWPRLLDRQTCSARRRPSNLCTPPPPTINAPSAMVASLARVSMRSLSLALARSQTPGWISRCTPPSPLAPRPSPRPPQSQLHHQHVCFCSMSPCSRFSGHAANLPHRIPRIPHHHPRAQSVSPCEPHSQPLPLPPGPRAQPKAVNHISVTTHPIPAPFLRMLPTRCGDGTLGLHRLCSQPGYLSRNHTHGPGLTRSVESLSLPAAQSQDKRRTIKGLVE